LYLAFAKRLCFSDPLTMSDKASTAHMFNNMTLDIEQLLTKVVSILVTLLHFFLNVEHDIGTLQF